ncbi:MAG: cold-shock protein [Phycisphaerae bacterium]|nr:cold-shock protein [Phycisphaerae bacterium]MDG1899507.1 cold-shock protein [Phycisphaerales bacterium]
MPTGTIGRYFDQKGFGFIKPDEGEKDLFVHITEIKSEGVSTLTEGQRVTYEVVDGQKGPKAVNVEIDG